MPYQYYREWGLVDGSADYMQLLILLVLTCVIVGISEFLLNRQRFRGHLVFMSLMALVMVAIGLNYALDSLIVWMLVFLVICLWDHYCAKNRLGQSPMPRKKAKHIQSVAVVILAVCGVMSLGIGFLQDWNTDGWNLGWALLVLAGYITVRSFLHRNDTTDK